MKLQGRNLEPNFRGDDVKLLQSELRQLKLKTQIVDPEGFFGSTTFLAVQEFQNLHRLEVTGTVDQETARLINREVDESVAEMFIVRGEVRRSDGDPMRGVIVRALRKRLRKDDLIGQATTSATGDYNIEYQATERPVSIVVQASDTAGKVIATSDVICKARPVEIVNLNPDGVFRGPSEFKQLQDRLAPILKREQIRIEALEAADVELLACAHDLNREHVTLLVASSRMAREAGMEAEAFYALVRQGLPTVLIALVAQSPETLRRALETSVSENIVGAQIRDQIPQILRDLQGQIVRLALEEPTPDRPTFRSLLDIAGVARQRQQTLVTTYVERKGTVAEFWRQVRQEPGISDEDIETLQYTIGAAAIALNYPPLTRELARMRRAGQLGRHLRDLARFNRDDWERLIKGQPGGARIGAPALLGEKEEEREARYAEFLPRMVEALFPTAVLAHRLAETNQTAFRPTLTFLQRNPDFDFRSMRAHEFLRDHPDALDGIADRDTAVKQLRAVQRMMNIAPHFNKARTVALIADNVDSAFKIRRMGAAQFVRTRTEALGGAAAAEQVYTNAARQSDTALMLLSQSKIFNPTSPGIIAPHLFGEGVPDLEDLFGSLDLCQCEHCASVYSPAAYLVDILHFLMNRPAETSGRTALDVLFGNPADETRRRWDIGEIELTCQNTNTELPHIDLVNEILEQAVAPNSGFPFQTEEEADALGASPEHINEQAYNVLADAVYPWSLPFDLWAAESRRYLPQLGVRRDVLMDRFRREGAAPLPIDVVAEYLGLTPRERDIINGGSPQTVHQMWGLEVAEFNRLLNEGRAAVVLERSGLSYEELVELLDVRFVDPGGAMRIQFAGADCNLATATITGLTTTSLGRLHRFVRLQRKLGWPISELGDTLATLGASSLNDDALALLAQVKRLREALGMPLETTLAWWSPRLSTQARDRQPSLYDRVFNDPTVNPPEVDIFRLNNPRTELDNPNLPIGEHIAAVSVSLGVGAHDLTLLLAGELPNDRLNLANLSRLYKASTLSKALKIPIRDYVVLRALTGIDPFDGVTATDRFVERTRLVRESGFDLATLDYLLRHRVAVPAATADAQVSEFLARLRERLKQIAADHEFASDPAGTRTAENLALILPSDIVNRTVALLNGSSTEDQASRIALINDHLAQFLDPVEAIQQLVDPAALTEPEERFDYILERLLSHLSRVAGEAFVVDGFASALGLAAEVTNPLLRELVPAPNDANLPILSVFLATMESPDQIAAFHRLAKIAVILNALKVPSEQVAFTITRGGALGWLDLNALPLATQDSGALLFERWLAMVTLFRAAANLPNSAAALFGLFNDLDNQELTRDEFLDALANRTGWNRDDLDFLTGPDGFDLQFRAGFADGQFLTQLKRCFELLTPLGVAAQEAWRWAQPAPNAVIARAIKQTVRAKFDHQQQWLGAARPIRDELRNEQRDALVARLLHTTRIIIPTLETPQPTLSLGARRPAVEELQLKLNASGAFPPLEVDDTFGLLTRAAVIAFQEASNLTPDGIVGPPTWAGLNQARQRLRGTNDLYAQFLVDVEMEPCMLTSRIALATTSVQLFVQRCLLNLEREVALSPEDAKEWAWMKSYRVWEANRKVFLYPENWIEPELRDDKTPFFMDMEHGLLQDEINESTVEREYLKYLQDLDRVAQLEISGLYRQWEVDRDILHVFGRTRNTPPLYYYRRWVDQRSWTSWERVDIGIDAEHVVPVVWNRRLYIFWPSFTENAQEALNNDPAKPRRYYEIRLAWSEYRDGKWSPRRVSNEPATTATTTELPSREELAFWTQIDNEGRLYIFFGVHRNASPQLAPNNELFRFAECNGALEVSSGVATVIKIQTRFPGTNGYFNGMMERASSNVLTAITGGEIFTNEVWKFLPEGAEKTADVLLKTPGAFRLMVPHAERPFVSQSPFFYQDDSRTFFVMPRGKYVGGFTGPNDAKITDWQTTPLELPDIVTTQITRILRSNTILSPGTTAIALSLPMNWEATFFRFENFYHPYISLLIEQLNRHGIEGMLRPDPEQEPPSRRSLVNALRRQRKSEALFNSTYKPNEKNVVNVYELSAAEKSNAGPLEEFDFSYGGAFSIYNWELFFHAPFMLAKRLSANQRFTEAHRWFHYIFDPTYVAHAEPWPERVWQIKPFFDHGVGKSIERAILLLKSSGLSRTELDERKSLRDQIEAWRKTPFNPHLIARMRNEAYMKTVVMAYLDNMIAWGDHLFHQDNRESINEAIQLYILAAEILGARPKEIPAHEGARKTIDGEEVRTFNQLSDHLDAFSNALIDLETIVYPMDTDTGGGGINGVLGATDFTLKTGNGNGPAADLPLAAPDVEPPDNGSVLDLPLATPIPAVLGPTLFFCIPKNDKLLGYWDTVADRLFKIRHCLNIEGVARQLALFAPPIDPGLLVKAAAAGLDIADTLSDLNAPTPNYRFRVMTQKANEIVNDVKSLGAALLAALEKKDAEVLALLRSVHEIQLVEVMREIKEQRVNEEKNGLAALLQAKKTLELSHEFYANRRFMNDAESGQLSSEESAKISQKAAGEANESAAIKIAFRPDISLSSTVSIPLGTGFSVGSTVGGTRAAAWDQMDAASSENRANSARASAIRAGLLGAWLHRFEEWVYQKDLAIQQTKEIEKQTEGAEIRIAIAERELQNHDLQISNAKAVDEYMRSKYTNQEIYSWMISQISAVYFQSYQLAYDVAKRAERAYRYELGLAESESNFIQFGYWDSLKKGLLAGERLSHDLKRMEVSYLEKDRREYEITQHFSLALLAPNALLRLREVGSCEFEIPELAFDVTYPGHYMRRIKSVSVTIPCVAGPYTNVNATLSLLRNRVRISGDSQQDYSYTGMEDLKFRHDLIGVQSIATSSGQNDSGVFQLNFEDERYLPFERTGAISRWRLSLPGEFRPFDYNTISDVILQMSYTARDGGNVLRDVVTTHVSATINRWLDELAGEGAGLQRLISLKREFPNELHQFLFPAQGQNQATELPMSKRYFPYFVKDRELTVSRIDLFLKPKDGETVNLESLALTINQTVGSAFSIHQQVGLPFSHFALTEALSRQESIWRLAITNGSLSADSLEDLYLLVTYHVGGEQ